MLGPPNYPPPLYGYDRNEQNSNIIKHTKEDDVKLPVEEVTTGAYHDLVTPGKIMKTLIKAKDKVKRGLMNATGYKYHDTDEISLAKVAKGAAFDAIGYAIGGGILAGGGYLAYQIACAAPGLAILGGVVGAGLLLAHAGSAGGDFSSAESTWWKNREQTVRQHWLSEKHKH